MSAASDKCLLCLILTHLLGALRHVHRETAIQSTPDLQGSHSQVLVSTVRWCVSSDCGYGYRWARQPEQGDEGPDTHLQSRLW